MNQKVAEVYRMTITSDDILGTLEALSCLGPGNMPVGARNLQKKFQLQAAKINIGAATPAYVTTGHKAKQEITVDALGGFTKDTYEGTHPETPTPATLFTSGSPANPVPAKPKADLDDEEARMLEELDRQMREEMAANGAGSENVILEDRRKVPRVPEAAIDVSQL